MHKLALGKLAQLAVDRHERDLKLARRRAGHPKGFWFDDAAADRVVLWIETFCRHSKGQWRGQPIVLEHWQKEFVLRPLFGWKKRDGRRRYNKALVSIARKNAKSTLAAAIGLYMMVGDGEGGAEVYSSATKRDQAKIVHDAATDMVKQSPELSEHVTPLRNNLVVEALGASFKPLASDSRTMDGLNPHCSIVDELHAHEDRHVWDVLITAMGSRRQPLHIAITTAGVYDPESIGWEMYEYAVKVLEGSIEDDNFFAIIFEADEGDKFEDPLAWEKANPNLGVSITREYLEEQCRMARTMPSFRQKFERYHLDRWTNAEETWIPPEKWASCEKSFTENDLRGRACFGGIDLSTKLDISALCLLFPAPDDDRYRAIWRFWVPEELVQERDQKGHLPSYSPWVEAGLLRTTPGNVIDYREIREEIIRLSKMFSIVDVGYDPWNATQMAIELQDEGIQMVEVRQGFRSLSEPCKEFERLITDGRFEHDGTAVMKWMISNLKKREDPNENIAPDKRKTKGRIDGAVASIIALARAIGNPDGVGGSIYNQRGVIAFG